MNYRRNLVELIWSPLHTRFEVTYIDRARLFSVLHESPHILLNQFHVHFHVPFFVSFCIRMNILSTVKTLALLPLFCDLVLGAKGTSGTCSKDKKCDTGCCSKAGYCGFGPNFCGDSVCISNCDAQAECGKYAPVVNQTCPLNVCCSEFGFCGTSSDFCGKGCQSGCDDVKQPSCSGSSSSKVYGGYFEAWNYERACDTMTPSDINVNPWTHMFYSFAGIDTGDSTIETVYDLDDIYIEQMNDLKKKKPSLKTFISVGGWDLGGEPFSDMVRFSGLRKSFIDSVISFMDDRGFDGIDIDWEYPAATDRGKQLAFFLIGVYMEKRANFHGNRQVVVMRTRKIS